MAYGIGSGWSCTGAIFLPVLRFPLPVLILTNAAYASVTRDWKNRLHNGRGTTWIQSHSTLRIKNVPVVASRLRYVMSPYNWRNWTGSVPPSCTWWRKRIQFPERRTVKPVFNGLSRVQNIFPLKPSFRLIKVHYDSHRTWSYFRLIRGPFKTGFTVYEKYTPDNGNV
jgi:hypothetical protein